MVLEAAKQFHQSSCQGFALRQRFRQETTEDKVAKHFNLARQWAWQRPD
jgi:hypothetical protein